MSDIAHLTPLSSRETPAAPRPPRYSGRAVTRPWPRTLLAGLCAVALGLSVGGCSISYKLDSWFGEKEDAKPATTGSVPAAPAAQPPKPGASSAAPQGRDLAFAKAAVSEVLSRGGSDASQPWENPESGARGTVTPVAAAYTHEGFTCRDFRASYVRGESESWLQGEACRMHRGKWEVRSMRPLQGS
jgi:hypothetical protein